MYKNLFYSTIAQRELKSVGNNFYLSFPSSIVGAKYISIGDNFQSFARLRLDAIDNYLGNNYNPEIIIGNNVNINYDCHIGCINKIVIGDNVLIASKVFITDHTHGEISNESIQVPPSLRILRSKGSVTIGDGVWIGEGVVILPGVAIGKNAVLGANAVITKDVPPGAIVGGIPARTIKQLF